MSGGDERVIAKAGEMVKPFGYILFHLPKAEWLCGFALKADGGDLKKQEPVRRPEGMIGLNRGLGHRGLLGNYLD